MRIRFGLRTKVLLITTLLLVLIFGGITTVQIRDRTRELRTNLLEESKAFATLATQPIGNTYAIYKDSGTIKISQEIGNFMELNPKITNISIVNVSGETLFSHPTDTALEISTDEASTFEPIYKYGDSSALETVIYPFFEASGARRYSLVYSVSDEEISKAVMNEAESLLVSGFLSLIVTLGLVYVFINRFILKPVETVSKQAGIISAGNLEQQIEIKGHDEIASLGNSVNKMAESLKANIAELQQVDKVKSEFMMITSHNLRTPLTIIDGYVENMPLLQNDPEKLTSAMNKISASVKRLEHFAEDILTISRFELGNNSLLKEKVRFGEFMNRLLDEFILTAELKNQTVEKEIGGEEAILDISTPYISSSLWNILDNAAKFTDEGGKITVKSYLSNNTIVIEITDTGIGIAADEIPKLFKKFHRGTSTLTYDYEGTGIGLYASKMMIERHGGSIEVTSELGKGSTFTVRLPVTASEPAATSPQ